MILYALAPNVVVTAAPEETMVVLTAATVPEVGKATGGPPPITCNKLPGKIVKLGTDDKVKLGYVP